MNLNPIVHIRFSVVPPAVATSNVYISHTPVTIYRVMDKGMVPW
jgi:hypothetical protein